MDLRLSKLNHQFKAKWVSNRPGVTPAQFYDDVVLKLTEVVKSVRIDLLKERNGSNIYKVRKIISFPKKSPFFTFVKPKFYMFTD